MQQRPPASSRNLQLTRPMRVRKQQAQAPLRRTVPGMLPPAPPAMRPNTPGKRLPQRAKPAKPARKFNRWWVIAPLAGFVVMIASLFAAILLGVLLVYANGILPGVQAGGVALGGLSQTEAARKLQNEWAGIRLVDGDRSWQVNPAALGITLDASATANTAYEQGRSEFGSLLRGLLGQIDLPPVIQVDTAVAAAALNEYAAQFEQAPVNAGVRLVNGQVQPTPPINGRALDVGATVTRLQNNSTLLADGRLEVVMRPVQPAVTDASPMVEQATRLLSDFIDIRLYDPITGDIVFWSLPPDQWGNWLTATPSADTPTGLSLTADAGQVRDYLTQQAGTALDSSRYIDVDKGVAAVQQVLAAGRTNPTLRVYHHDRQHTVRAGETIIRIAWDYGVPYLYIQEANGGISNVSVGQSITIPSPDNFLPFEPNPDKRVVVSISQQRTWVYENNQLKWEWVSSTGIADSPTWPGVYQVISHYDNAYAANWNLWMPNFLGVYQPIPGVDFTNGFHGFPTRGGGQLLWENSLGTRVTYGCILLNNTNAQLLYNWAEEGVVVEIQG